MIVSAQNIAGMATISSTTTSSTVPPSVLTDGDFSTAYAISMPGSVTFTFKFSAEQTIGYIAISGSNAAQKGSISIDLLSAITLADRTPVTDKDGAQLYHQSRAISATLGRSESNVLMFDTGNAKAKEVRITISGGTSQLHISDIAMGKSYEIPRGEQGGYSRPWTVPNIKSRSSAGLDGSPINMSYEAAELKGTLTVKDNLMADFAGWYEFIRFAASNVFYILEDDDPTHAYACWNGSPSMTKADATTRLIGSSSIKFSAFAKSTEAYQ